MANYVAGNVFVKSTPLSQSAEVCRSIIGFRNAAIDSVITGQAEDATYPFTNALDFRDNTQYSPAASSGSVTIEFRQTVATGINYIGIARHNGVTAGLSCVLEVLIGGVWTAVKAFAPIGDDKTMCEYFEVDASSRQRLTLNFTSKLYIGSIYIGRAWKFERHPNLGFVPGASNNVDRVINSQTDGGQFIMGRRQVVGFEQNASYDFIAFDSAGGINQEYIEFMEHVKDSKPFFMKWAVKRADSMFGRQKNPNSLRPPSYESSQYGSVTIDMVGLD